MRGISWLAASQSAAQEGLCTVEWVSKYRNSVLSDCDVLLRMFSLNFFRNESRYSQRLIKAPRKLHVTSSEKRIPLVGFNIRISFEKFIDIIEQIRPVLFSSLAQAFLRTACCLHSVFPSLVAGLIRWRALRQHACFQLYFPRSSFIIVPLFVSFSFLVLYCGL